MELNANADSGRFRLYNNVREIVESVSKHQNISYKIIGERYSCDSDKEKKIYVGCKFAIVGQSCLKCSFLIQCTIGVDPWYDACFVIGRHLVRSRGRTT